MLHVKLNGNEIENKMQVNILPFYTPTPPNEVKRSKQFISEVVHKAYYIESRENTCRTLCKIDIMHAPDRSHIGIVQISLF